MLISATTIVVYLNDGHESFLGDVDLTHRPHPLLALCLLLEQLLLTGYVAWSTKQAELLKAFCLQRVLL